MSLRKILVLKSSADYTIEKLFEEIENNEIDCMIQTSQINKYKKLYPNINFIDIQNEGFYELSESVMQKVRVKTYDDLFITLTGTAAYNFGNVMQIVAQVHSRKMYFYNCEGEKIEIPPVHFLKDFLYRILICFIETFY